MRHRGWVDVAALLLMAGGAWLIWDVKNDGRLDAAPPGLEAELNSAVWFTVVSAAALGLASVALLVAARAPRLARRSPPLAAVLVLVAAAAQLYDWVRVLSTREVWTSGPDGSLRLTGVLQPVTGVLCLSALALGIALPLLRPGGSRSGPAATGAAVLWGTVTGVILVRDAGRRYELGTMIRLDGEHPWLVGVAGLLVVAAGLLVTAWCAGPPADRGKVLARSRGGYAAVALLLPQIAALDFALATLDFGGVESPARWWLLLRAGLVLGCAVAAAGAALVPSATPALAAVVPGLGLAACAVNYLPAADPLYVQIVGIYPVLVAAVASMLLAAVVAYAVTRSPAPSVPLPS